MQQELLNEFLLWAMVGIVILISTPVLLVIVLWAIDNLYRWMFRVR